MVVCSCCKELARWYLSAAKEFPQIKQFARDHPLRKYVYHHSWNALKQSALGGCSFCDFVVDVFKGDLSDGNLSERTLIGFNDVVAICRGSQHDTLVFEHLPFFHRYREVKVRVPEGDPASLFPFYLTTLKPGAYSDHSLLLTKQWFRTCVENHIDCRSMRSGYVPSRLIDVGPPDGSMEPYLVETKESTPFTTGSISLTPEPPSLRYATLSHCWGKSNHFTTTTATIKDRKLCIPWADLAQTFRDAVTVTRAVPLRYLWIDSFCILQDSPTDWDQESQQMDSVYANGALNIASFARDPGEGFLFLEKDPGILPYDIDYPTKGRKIGQLWFDSEHAHNSQAFRRGISDLPEIHYRGWVLQEEILSSFTITLGMLKAEWTCRVHHAKRREPTRNFWPDQRRREKLGFLKARRTFPKCLQAVSSSASSLPEALQLWRIIVENFSHRALTFATDTLPAISGLAAQFHAIIGGQYLAGMWERDLPSALLWWNRNNLPCLSKEYPRFIAPTWSWASSPCALNFLDYKCLTQFDVEVKAASVSLKGLNSFGEVSGGTILLRGRLHRSEIAFITESHGRVTGVNLGGENSFIDGIFDHEPDYLIAGDEVWLLVLGYEEGKLERPRALILRTVDDEPETYKRIGFYRGLDIDEVLSAAPHRTVTII